MTQALSRADRGVSEAFSDASGIPIPPHRPSTGGNWADEFPLHSREISEALYEAQRSIQLLEDEDPRQDTEEHHHDDEDLEEEAGMTAHNSTASSQQQHPVEGNAKNAHIARCYKYDPYSVQEPYNVMYCCHCETCIQTLQNTTNSMSSEATLSPAAMGLTESDFHTANHTLMMNSYSNNNYDLTMNNANEYDMQANNGNEWDAPQSAQMYSANNELSEGMMSLGVSEAEADCWDNTATTTTGNTSPQQQYYNHSSNLPSPQQQQVRHQQQQRMNAPSPVSAVSSSTNSRTSQQQQAAPKSGFQTHAGLASAAGHQYTNPARHAFAIRDAMAPQTISGFMPPPPPPFVLAEVLAQEDCPNPQGVHYHIIKRWYNRVLESQQYFVSGSEVCPPPDQNKYSFDTWCEMAMGWWYKHFEHMQKRKTRFHYNNRRYN